VIRLSDGEIVEDRRLLGVRDAPPVLHAQKSAHRDPAGAGTSGSAGAGTSGSSGSAGAGAGAGAEAGAGVMEAQP
jgi:hypothetical protein